MNGPAKLEIGRRAFCPTRKEYPKHLFVAEAMRMKFSGKRLTAPAETERQQIGTDQYLFRRRRDCATVFCGFSKHRRERVESRMRQFRSRGFGWDLGKSRRIAKIPAGEEGPDIPLPTEARRNSVR